MTQDTKTALELLARCKRLHAAVNKTEEETRGFNSLDAGKSLRYELIYADVNKSVSAGEELRVFCKGKLSIKQDLEAEIKKIDAESRAEGNKFDRENKAKLDRLKETVRNEGAKHNCWERAKTITRIVSWLLAIGWAVSFFALFSNNPPKIVQELSVFVFLGPIVLCLGLGAIIRGFMDDGLFSATKASDDAKKEIESIRKERAEVIASVEKKKADYLEILKLV